MKKLLLTVAIATTFASSAAWSQVVVRVGPPRVIIERPGPRPGLRYVWMPGYYRWGGARYIWVPGRYEIPPRPGVAWVAPRWVQRNGAWIFVAGFWR